MDVQRRWADPHLSLAAQWSQNGRHTQVNSSFFSNIVIDFSSESNDFLPNVTSSHFGQIYLYMVILVAKHSKSKVINCAMILSCCTITWLVMQQTHGRKTLALMAVIHLAILNNHALLVWAHTTLCNSGTNTHAFLLFIAMILIAFGGIWIVCMSSILMRPPKQMQRLREVVQRMRQVMEAKIYR